MNTIKITIAEQGKKINVGGIEYSYIITNTNFNQNEKSESFTEFEIINRAA